MKDFPRWLRPLAWLLVLAAPVLATPQPVLGSDSPRELLRRLHSLSLDPSRLYEVQDLRLRRDELRVIFEHGRLVFLEPVAGQVTGALFVGEGSIIVMPRQKVEKVQLARFTGAPLLDERFSSAYLRFTDTAFGDLLQAIEHGAGSPVKDADFLARWAPLARNLNPQQSLRTLADLLSKQPRTFFHIGVVGLRLGPLEVRVDDRAVEQVVVGQTRWSGGVGYTDIWCSFPRRSADPAQSAPPNFTPTRYRIETRIHPSRVLEGETELEMVAQVSGERVFAVELARQLAVKSVTDETGQALDWFPGESFLLPEGHERASDYIVVVLAEPSESGRSYRLHVRYEGAVIYDVGNGVFYVGSRESWYPNLGIQFQADYELTFHYPRRLVLVATGNKESETEEGEWKTAHWLSREPLAVAGFNLGDYEVRKVRDKELTVEVYANRQLERALQPQPLAATPPILLPESMARRFPTGLPRPEPIASPAGQADDLAREALDAIRFFENYFGPFPYSHLAISQIPGNFGQGWPGLLYLSTFSFLRPSEQARVGLSARSREFFTDLVPFHEAAHQWWGNLVGWQDYRDQWISESLASYAGLLYLEKRRGDRGGMENWLKKYKDDLLAKTLEGRPVEQAGPIWLGKRLAASDAPGAYETIVYGKGAWVMHMLRHLLRDPKTGSDERFRQALREFLATYRHRTATSQDFRRIFNKYMPKSLDLEGSGNLDWFFEEWIYDTGIPRYTVESSVKPVAAAKPRFAVRGKIIQKEVPEHFTMPVPVYGKPPQGKLVLLGTVTTTGPGTPFHFSVAWKPSKIVLDPFHTILAVVE